MIRGRKTIKGVKNLKKSQSKTEEARGRSQAEEAVAPRPNQNKRPTQLTFVEENYNRL